MSKSIRISDKAYAALETKSEVESRTFTALVDLWLGVNGSVAGHAAGDPVVRRAEGGGLSDPRDAPSAPVRLGQAASSPDGSVAEKNEGAADAGQVISDLMIEEHRSNSRDPVRLVRGTALLKTPAIERAPETVCARCRVPWKNHQEGSRKNRAGTTGCTRFEDPS